MHDVTRRNWTNRSVTAFAMGGDPVSKMHERSLAAVLNAMEHGWSGPPFDPFALAEMMHLHVVPNSDILDARTIPVKGDRLQIEYNPGRPRARIRYSVAHEIAHTFFDDCGERVRNRAKRETYAPDEWELEMLCNIGAAELLMPIGSLLDFKNREITMEVVRQLRKQFEVSTESILLRLIRITEKPYAVFAASRYSDNAKYSIDYSLSSRATTQRIRTGSVLPKDSVVSACTAIGFSAQAMEVWADIGPVNVECVGIPPYPGSVFPRIIGILRAAESKVQTKGDLRFVTGDATEPHGDGPLILAHVVNDATPNWGAGFGKAVQQRWPIVQSRFRNAWFNTAPKRLGEVFLSEADIQLKVCQLVCQHGYGASVRPRLRYAALRDCLTALRDHALRDNASIHMPRIGTGEAGGSWGLVNALIDEVLCAAGLSVTVYDLPKSRKRRDVEIGLFDRVR
jgi:hypothetical protein